MPQSHDPLDDLTAGFRKALNRHGYTFQYLVCGEAQRLYEKGDSPWQFIAAEFPVETPSAGTRIDLILRHRQHPHIMVVECKRANPAVANWCFAKAPRVSRNRSREYYFAERLVRNESECSSAPIRSTQEIDAYHIALEVRRQGAKGDVAQSGRGSIEEAATQVLRGVNGLAELFLHHPELLGDRQYVVISPAIVTTAELFISPVNLLVGDLGTGEVDDDFPGLEKRTWTNLQYHQSPSLKHSGEEARMYPVELWRILDSEYVRTVPIVSAEGIGEFLSWSSHLGEDYGDFAAA